MRLKVPERAVMQAIAQYLGTLENIGKVAWWTRVNSGGMKVGKFFLHLARKGTPDFVGCLDDGQFFGIEAKGSEGKATPEQLNTLLKIKSTGAIGVLAYSVNDVEKAFGEG